MRTNTILLLASFALALSTLSMHASAQNSPKSTPQAPPAAKSAEKPAAKTGGDDFFVGLVQTGKAAREAASWRRSLAQVQLALEVDGKAEFARDELTKLRDELAASSEFDGRQDIAVETLDLSIRVLLTLGNMDRALQLIDPARAKGPWKAELERIRADPRVVALAARLHVGSQSVNAPDVQEIERVVTDAVKTGATKVILELGSVAAPALEALVRADPDALSFPSGIDPLDLLVRCDPNRAAVFIRELLAAPNTGFLLARRILSAMSSSWSSSLGKVSRVWGWEALDTFVERPPVLLIPEWRSVVTTLLGISTAAVGALPFVERFVQFDALDEPSRRALVEIARSGEPDTSAQLAAVLRDGGMRPTVRPLLEELLAAPSPEVRIAAAQALRWERRNPALLARVDDPDWRVRAVVAASLQKRNEVRVQYSSNGNQGVVTQRTLIEFDPADRPVLERLMHDPAPEVQRSALSQAADRGIALDAEVAARVLSGQDAQLRSLAVRCLPEDPDVAATLLDRALQDGVADVRVAAWNELLHRLGVLNPANDRSFRFPDAPMHAGLRDLALRAWLEGSPEIANDSRGWQIVRRCVRTPADAQALVRAVVQSPRSPANDLTAVARHLNPTDEQPAGYWMNLDAELVEALLRGVLAEKFNGISDVARDLAKAERPAFVRSAVATIVRNPTVQRSYRCLFLLALRESPHAGALLTDLLTNPAWGPDEDGQEFVNTALRGRIELPPDVIIAALPALVSGQVPARVVESQIKSLIAQRRMPDEYAAPLIARFAAEPFALEESLDWAIRREAALGHWDSVRPMLDANFLSTAAIGAVGRGRPPEGLSWLAAILDDPNQASSKGTLAATAIAGYLSEEAAEILLRGAQSAPTPEVRKACLDGVAEIRAFLDQKASWQQRESGRLQRDTAVAELVRMLDSTDAQQRAQAARGLGTLEAAETIPRLIRLLKDADAGVQKAAQEALDRLND